MKKNSFSLITIIIAILSLSVILGTTSIKEFIGNYKSSASGNRIEIDGDDQKIRFFNNNNDEMGYINAKDDYGNRYLNINFQFVNISANSISTKGTLKCENSATFKSIKATNYQSSSGAYGKTYTEEFEDKQGNIRTRVYENGLLISYKINGIEQ